MSEETVTKLIPMLDPKLGGKTILGYADSGGGKTTLVGELAEHLFTYAKAPDGRPMRTRVYTADYGGTDVLTPHVKLGIVELVLLYGRPAPWEWINAACLGKKLNAAGQWVEGRDPDIGLYAFEGATSMGGALRLAIGPGSNERLETKPLVGGDKDAHGRSYGQAQDRMGENIKLSFHLPGIKLWTALTRRGDDNTTTQTILGPEVTGNALTSVMMSWFNFTFPIVCLPADDLTKQPERHRLYLTSYIDQLARGAKGLGNSRRPLDGGELPPFVEPASLVRALYLIDKASGTAEASIRARLVKAGVLK